MYDVTSCTSQRTRERPSTSCGNSLSPSLSLSQQEAQTNGSIVGVNRTGESGKKLKVHQTECRSTSKLQTDNAILNGQSFLPTLRSKPDSREATSCLMHTGSNLDQDKVQETHPSSSNSVAHQQSSRSTNIIPGVEHVFFETEMERMEQAHTAPAGMDIVVLAVDNSKPSDMAFQFYVDNVNRPGYFLHLVHHSNYWGNYEPMDGGPSPKHCMELMDKENAKVKEIEDKYSKLMKQNNIQGDFICLRGKDAWHDIIQHQEKVNAIMIVMGTRGQNSLRRTFMGSVSDSVVHHAHCPVLVCCHPKEHQ